MSGSTTESDVQIEITGEMSDRILKYLASNQKELLRIPHIRNEIVAERMKRFLATQGVKDADFGPDVNPGAGFGKNRQAMLNLEALDRPDYLITPLRSISDIALRIKDLQVLSIGPRTEAEIFTLMVSGFEQRNIAALDLFSYSPWIDTGDMHQMPYDDASFDIVIVGWVLTYSNNNKRAAEEILRVVKPGGYIAVGCRYFPTTAEYLGHESRATLFNSTRQILDLFESRTGKVIFEGDMEPTLAHLSQDLIVILRTKS